MTTATTTSRPREGVRSSIRRSSARLETALFGVALLGFAMVGTASGQLGCDPETKGAPTFESTPVDLSGASNTTGGGDGSAYQPNAGATSGHKYKLKAAPMKASGELFLWAKNGATSTLDKTVQALRQWRLETICHPHEGHSVPPLGSGWHRVRIDLGCKYTMKSMGTGKHEATISVTVDPIIGPTIEETGILSSGTDNENETDWALPNGRRASARRKAYGMNADVSTLHGPGKAAIDAVFPLDSKFRSATKVTHIRKRHSGNGSDAGAGVVTGVNLVEGSTKDVQHGLFRSRCQCTTPSGHEPSENVKLRFKGEIKNASALDSITANARGWIDTIITNKPHTPCGSEQIINPLPDPTPPPNPNRHSETHRPRRPGHLASLTGSTTSTATQATAASAEPLATATFLIEVESEVEPFHVRAADPALQVSEGYVESARLTDMSSGETVAVDPYQPIPVGVGVWQLDVVARLTIPVVGDYHVEAAFDAGFDPIETVTSTVQVLAHPITVAAWIRDRVTDASPYEDKRVTIYAGAETIPLETAAGYEEEPVETPEFSYWVSSGGTPAWIREPELIFDDLRGEYELVLAAEGDVDLDVVIDFGGHILEFPVSFRESFIPEEL